MAPQQFHKAGHMLFLCLNNCANHKNVPVKQIKHIHAVFLSSKIFCTLCSDEAQQRSGIRSTQVVKFLSGAQPLHT